jgi:hypothetical protein
MSIAMKKAQRELRILRILYVDGSSRMAWADEALLPTWNDVRSERYGR